MEKPSYREHHSINATPFRIVKYLTTLRFSLIVNVIGYILPYIHGRAAFHF